MIVKASVSRERSYIAFLSLLENNIVSAISSGLTHIEMLVPSELEFFEKAKGNLISLGYKIEVEDVANPYAFIIRW